MYSYMGTNHPDLLSNRNEAPETGPSQQNAGEGTPFVRFIENRDGKFFSVFSFSILRVVQQNNVLYPFRFLFNLFFVFCVSKER